MNSAHVTCAVLFVDISGSTRLTKRSVTLMLRAGGLIGSGHSPVDGQGAPVEFSCGSHGRVASPRTRVDPHS